MKSQEEKTEKYGVENIKKAHSIAANLSEGIYTIVEDGTNMNELIGVGSNLVLKSMGNIPTLKHIPREYADMSEVEKKEVNEHFAKEHDLPNDVVESIIEKSQTFLNAAMDLGFSMVQGS